MVKIGCTGGIGSGKSTVCALLRERGAKVIDADAISRALTARGGSAFALVVEAFGKQILTPDGVIDRKHLAEIVFRDEHRRRALEDIVHPLVSNQIDLELMTASPHEIVIIDHPLLLETDARDRFALDGVLVVDLAPDIATQRLLAQREMTLEQVNERIAAQITREERLRAADFILMNMGTMAELREMVRRAWEWMVSLGD
jgi:dephospho-CoA kinase